MNDLLIKKCNQFHYLASKFAQNPPTLPPAPAPQEKPQENQFTKEEREQVAHAVLQVIGLIPQITSFKTLVSQWQNRQVTDANLLLGVENVLEKTINGVLEENIGTIKNIGYRFQGAD
jgi:hypothetical protein